MKPVGGAANGCWYAGGVKGCCPGASWAPGGPKGSWAGAFWAACVGKG
ncbi:hypothetical protein ACFQ0B_04970 [Nonomuraea thailandensis]